MQSDNEPHFGDACLKISRARRGILRYVIKLVQFEQLEWYRGKL